MDIKVYLQEFAADWQLTGKAVTTVENYCAYLRELVGDMDPDAVTLPYVKSWLAATPSAETARYRGRAVRAFGKWARENDGPRWTWSSSVPLAATPPKRQPTVGPDDFTTTIARTRSLRDRTVIELLWATGMRVSELARVRVEDIDLLGGYVSIPRTKTGRPRVAPLSAGSVRVCRRLIGDRTDGPLLGMSAHAIQLLLRRLGAPTAHAWRRGWAVNALREGVSEASVRAAAGWSSGAMVARYTSAVSVELAVAEFHRARGTVRPPAY